MFSPTNKCFSYRNSIFVTLTGIIAAKETENKKPKFELEFVIQFLC